MRKTYKAPSGHVLYIEPVKFDDLPEDVKKFDYIEGNQSYHVVKNWNKDGVVFFYIAKSQGEWLVWFSRGAFWSGYGKTLTAAIDGAQKDGWMYA